jgi:hypothetical protein
MVKLIIDGGSYDAEAGEHLIDVINRIEKNYPRSATIHS